MKLARLITELQKASERGSFTRIQNLHLTLQFIGETENIRSAQEAVAAVDFKNISLSFDSFSGFKRQGGEICWLGGADNRELTNLASSVGKELYSRGFKLEDKPFLAHLTLGREVVFKKEFEPEKLLLPPDLSVTVEKISLMKSERVRGILTYTEMFVKNAVKI
jgi:2'-5' RNA ligase